MLCGKEADDLLARTTGNTRIRFINWGVPDLDWAV